MAGLINEQYLRDTFLIHQDVKSPRITPYLIAASRRLKSWVGNSVYGTQDNEAKEVLRLAEATLAMHFLIRNLNTSIRGKGLVSTEKIERDTVVTYLNPAQTEQTAHGYLADAEVLVRDLKTDAVGADIGFVAWQIT